MRIHLHIERLVVDGVSVSHPRALRGALEQALTKQLVEGGLSRDFHSGGATPHLRGGAITLTQGSRSTALGSQIAGAVYQGIGARK